MTTSSTTMSFVKNLDFTASDVYYSMVDCSSQIMMIL